MKINDSRFVTSFASTDKYVEYASAGTAPEICVVGRSNVGKSTFINMLASRSKLAKTSSTPGRTRLVNVFELNKGELCLVDLPGYGYAQAGKKVKEEWGELIEGYLRRSSRLKHTFVLVDSRHAPTELDKRMTEYLYFYRMPFTVLATKCDKLTKAELAKSVQLVAAELKLGRDNIIPVSQDGYGKERVLARIEEVLSAENEQ